MTSTPSSPPTQPDSANSVAQILDELVGAAGAMTALAITKNGVRIAEAGITSFMNTSAMAALVAGMFSATREVARMVGEERFSILLQQGERRHIHISLIDEDTMMVVVFEDYQRIGRVRLEARKAGENLATKLASARARSRADLSTPQFKEYAFNLIDSIFATKSK